MRKKKTLYEVNRWNRPAFMPKENLFDSGGVWSSAALNTPEGAFMASQGFDPTQMYKQSRGGLFNMTKAANPFSKGNLKNFMSGAGSNAIGVASSAVGGLVGNAISGGLKSGAGSLVSGLGDIASQIPVLDKFSGAFKIVGGGIDALLGEKVNEQALKEANEGTAQLNNTKFTASTTDELAAQLAAQTSVANVADDIYEGGLLNDVSDKNDELKRQRAEAKMFAGRSLTNAANNIFSNQLNDSLANLIAFGGPIETIGDNNMGAIGYGFMSDYLAAKKKQADSKNHMTNMFMGTPSTMFDLGGDIQMHGGDYTTGASHIDAGNSHEMNPYDGVQMGVDQNGVPNLVEEGEVIFNDYVFSNRIEVPKEAQKWLGVKGKNLTFAAASKQLEKEIKERPNDPVSRAGLKAQMEKLEEEQEFVKRCTSYSVGEVYDVENNEMSLLNHNGYEYEKLG